MNDNSYKVIDADINEILPNRFQPRIQFDEEEILELSDSIKEHGVIQPIVVRTIGDKYEIIAGERRYKASVLAGKETVPVIIKNLNDRDSAELALIENVQRKNLTPIEEALSYKKILDMGYLTQETLATKIGKSQSSVANKIRLLNLSDEVQEALLDNKISERHARSLLRLKSISDQNNLLEKIISQRLTVRKTDQEIDEILNGNNIKEEGNVNMENTPNKVPSIGEESGITFDIFASQPIAEAQTTPVMPTIEPVAPVVEPQMAPVMPTIEPVASVVEPQMAPVMPTIEPVASVVEPQMAPTMPTIEPVASVNEPQMAPIMPTIEPVAPVVEPQMAPVMPTIEPVAPVVEPQMAPIMPTIEPLAPVNEPQMAPIMPTIEPVVPMVEPQMAPIMPTIEPVAPVVEPQMAPVMPTIELVAPVNEPQMAPVMPTTEPVASVVEPQMAPVIPTIEPAASVVEPQMVPITENFGISEISEFSTQTSENSFTVPSIDSFEMEQSNIPTTQPIIEPFNMNQENSEERSTIAQSITEPIIITDYNKQYDPIMPTMTPEKPTEKIDFKEIISAIRECSDKIEKYGYKIELEEYDLSTLYQVVFKIEK